MQAMETALRELDRMREKNFRAFHSRLDRARQMPALWQAYQDYLVASSGCGEVVVLRPEDAQSSLKARAQRLSGAREALCRELALHKLPEDFFALPVGCAKCADTGYTPEGDRCECLTRILNRALFDQRPGPSFEDHDPAVFPDPVQREKMEKVMSFAKEYCGRFSRGEKKGILISGETGLGKSFVLSCVARELGRRGFSVVFITAYRLFEQALRPFDAGEVVQRIQSADFLALDDLGCEPLYNKTTIEGLFSIINERLSAGKPMAVATNLSAEQFLARYTERIASRLLDKDAFRLIRLTGADLRLNRKGHADE